MGFSSEAFGRIVEEAVGYLDKHPDATVLDSLRFGALLELYVYGDPDSPAPVGLMGYSPISGRSPNV